MIVAGPSGFMKTHYRTFNMKDITPGDDYGMMRQMLRRRFSRLLRESRPDEDTASLENGMRAARSACRSPTCRPKPWTRCSPAAPRASPDDRRRDRPCRTPTRPRPGPTCC